MSFSGMEEEDEAPDVLCHLENVQGLVDALTAVRWKRHQDAVLELSEHGIVLIVEESGCLQAKVYLKRELFIRYDYNAQARPRFGVSLGLFVDCLNAFSVHGHSSVIQIQYPGPDMQVLLNSGLCQIKHWRSGHKYQCVEKKYTKDQETRPAGETSEFKLLSKHNLGEMAHEQTKEQMKHLEEELVKSKDEIELLKSERDNWRVRTEFVSKRLNSFMKNEIAVEARIAESIKQEDCIKMLKSELQTERERVQKLTLELEETTHSAVIRVEAARVAEMRKQEKCIRMMTSELAKMKRNIQEERKHSKAKQGAIKKVEEIGRELANARHDLACAIYKAEVAEAKLSNLEEKIKLTNEKHFCSICLDNENDMAFSCGHMTCRDCGSKLSLCPICREQINIRLRLFPG